MLQIFKITAGFQVDQNCFIGHQNNIQISYKVVEEHQSIVAINNIHMQNLSCEKYIKCRPGTEIHLPPGSSSLELTKMSKIYLNTHLTYILTNQIADN
mgnify:CR=1 FL=1